MWGAEGEAHMDMTQSDRARQRTRDRGGGAESSDTGDSGELGAGGCMGYMGRGESSVYVYGYGRAPTPEPRALRDEYV